MNVIRRKLFFKLGLHRLRLRNLFGCEPLALKHVVEVRVSTKVQLVRAVQSNPAILKQPCQHAVDNRCADLRLDVIPDDRKAV